MYDKARAQKQAANERSDMVRPGVSMRTDGALFCCWGRASVLNCPGWRFPVVDHCETLRFKVGHKLF